MCSFEWFQVSGVLSQDRVPSSFRLGLASVQISNKIGLWCHRWLSMGGRYILIKSVLESQAVYWMSMEALPRTVLTKIRKMMFNFLWNGHSESQRYHLCSWETLSRPKKNGGWGFRNLFHFNTALNTNTLWRVLTHESIWHRVILDKYLQNATLFNWLRKQSHFIKSASRIWSSLIRTIPIILHWLSWQLGGWTSYNCWERPGF
jgi:hypothetical protein